MEESNNKLQQWIEENYWLFALFGVPVVGAILAHLAHWSPAELIVLVGVLLVAGILITALLFWRRVRLVQAEAALKTAMLQRGLTVDEMERLLRAGPRAERPPPPLTTEDQIIGEIVGHMTGPDVSEQDLEKVLAALTAVEPGKKLALCSTLLRMIKMSDPDPDRMLAVIRGLTPGASTAIVHQPVG
jgi:hypothetical protein